MSTTCGRLRSNEKFPGVPRYRDHRVLLDRHAHEIDGIVISTPDHWHLDMGLAAIRAGKHVYLEKPLAPTIWECRELRKAAAASGVITQFGAQGHSFEALQVLREWVDAGVVGAIHAVHLWTDRMRPHDYVAPMNRCRDRRSAHLRLGTVAWAAPVASIPPGLCAEPLAKLGWGFRRRGR